MLDAIDHAGLAARETATSSFAHLLLRSISVNPIDGVRIVASCRTERLALATGDASHRLFTVPLFTDAEVRSLVERRVPDALADEIAALLTRSGRNPRCLDNLITTGRPFDPVSFPDALGERKMCSTCCFVSVSRRTDGSSDFNPDTTAEFTTRPRWAVFNNPNDDVNFDNIAVEYRLSDGSPWQASHFREQVPAIGDMDPAFDHGETFYPNYFRTSDIAVFDAMGYDK